MPEGHVASGAVGLQISNRFAGFGSFRMLLERGFPTFRLSVAALLLGGAALAGEISVPSGQPVTLSEVLREDQAGALWLRYRFVAPDLAELEFAAAEADMQHLCQTLALPGARESGLQPAGIIISLADRDLVFGQSAPEATQYFEAYTLEDDTCQPEVF